MTIAHTPAGAASAAPAPARVDLARTWMLRSPLVGGRETAADVLVIDLEDGLPAARKAEGRERARRAAAEAPVWLRISAAGTRDGEADLALGRELEDRLAGVVLAMCAGPDDVSHVSASLPAGTPIVAMVESAAALLAAPAIAAHPATRRLAFGTGDFRRDTGMSADRIALSWPRAQLVVASAAAGIAGPIDGPCGPIEQARDAALHAVSMGFTGTLALQDAVIAGAHAGYTPSPAEVEAARSVLSATPDGPVDGSYAPTLARARALVERAEALAAL
ncbi:MULTISPECIES: CoA ester lyase [Microbacterium]|uniref:HpcH/HpaI aldolase/citrate lyase family protein n=1 Tax=Microbacterium TaxID=33882 RepID=UPI0027893326|nr:MULTISPECIES: aldolase/citrate lyase family protein [Microbacterium]MDQ1085128.1 citrate lyase subunit beta/citryl-CoA lyase [Microbacterium sp. SORGH_AS_0344]MDQ1169565.1 citrate lyase subunit beta/citryl-CoA lyase [Microbacterium proteolyticum]